MPILYSNASSDVLAVLQTVVSLRFPELAAEDVTFRVQMASNGDQHAVKHHGSPCAAKIRVTKPEERADDMPDVWVIVDKRSYEQLSERSREAMFAHELFHLVLKRDKEDHVKRDDYDRPMLGSRPDDYTINGFLQVAQWYGEDAIEVQTHKSVSEKLKQAMFAFADADPTSAEAGGGWG